MCGVAGIIAPDLSANEIAGRLQRMTDAITHRGPDDEGFWVGDGAGIGMRRLSIIDVAGGQQPLHNERGNVHVVCNGEIYNFVSLRESLKSRGHVFSSSSDAEVLVHGYEDDGEDCFDQAGGMFGAAIYDETNRRLILGRDRMGKKPLYYARVGDRFLFASEIKSLLAAEPSLGTPDYTRLAEYLQFGYICEPNTFYRDIKKLPAGNVGVYENGELIIRPFWQLDFEADESKSFDDWAEELNATLLDAVQTRLQSEVPLGVFLSGGIDSSAMVAYAHEAGLEPLNTFTIAFDRPEWDESADAAQVAKHFGTNHHELRLSEADLRDDMPRMLLELTRFFDEPFADDSALPTYHVSRLAREHVTVILSGDGGDELFAGYTAYRGARFAEKYRALFPRSVGGTLIPSVASAVAKCLPSGPSYKMLRVAKVLRESALPLADSVRAKASIWTKSAVQQLVEPDVLSRCDLFGDQFLPERFWRVLNTDGDIVSRLSQIDIQTYMRDDILMKVDRMSMANSLEVRSPLLDHRIAELAAAMPTRMKLQGSNGKMILKHLLRQRLPAKILTKRKQGFAVPLRDWFRNGLTDVVGDYLLYGGGKLPSEIIRHSEVQRLVQEHRSGAADHGRRIWSLLSLAAWHDLYQSGNGAPSLQHASTTGMEGAT